MNLVPNRKTKIALFGNIANNFYRLGQALQDDPNVDVQLFLPSDGEAQSRPENESSNPSTELPPWIHRSTKFKLFHAFRKDSELIRILNTFDVVLFSSINVAIGYRVKKPFKVFLATGNDFTVFPFWDRYFEHGRQKGFRGSLKMPMVLAKAFFYEFIMRRGIGKMDFVVPAPIWTMYDAADRLRIPETKLRNAYFPLAINTDFFDPEGPAAEISNFKNYEAFNKCQFKIFCPSRILLKNTGSYLASGDFKGNDTLLRGFASFVKRNGITDAGLFFIDRNDAVLQDVEQLKDLTVELQMDPFVHWISKDNLEPLNMEEMREFYRRSDIVANDFSVGWFGSAALEALSCGKPVLSYINNEYFREHYSENPFINVRSESDIAEALFALYRDVDNRVQLGKRSREWILKNHSGAAIRKIYRSQIEEILKQLSPIMES